MKKIKKYGSLKENQIIDVRDWLPSDFDFVDYTEKNLPGLAKRIMTNHEITHIAHCLELLAKEYSGERSDDEFVEDLLKEDYRNALLNADDVNRIAIMVYVLFQINKVPIALRNKFKV